MYTTAQSSQSHFNLSFLTVQEVLFNKACRYVNNWLIEHRKNCTEVQVDRKFISKEKNMLKYSVRAIEQYLHRAHMFEVTLRNNNLEVSFSHTSQLPEDLLPGDITLQLGHSW